MKTFFFTLTLLALTGCSSLGYKKASSFKISDDLLVTSLNDKSFNIKDTSFYNSNVLVTKLNDSSVVIVSSMVDTVKTNQLLLWINKSLSPKKIIAVNTHFHADGTGGNEGYTNHGVEIWSSKQTHKIYQERAESMRSGLAKFIKNPRLSKSVLNRKNLPAHKFFNAREGLKLGDGEVIVSYHGPAHTSDNLVVYLPK